MRAFLDRLGDLSRPILRRRFRSDLAVESKADGSPVTRADRECEAALRAAIRGAFPEDGILGEEEGLEEGGSGRLWVLDPLDGTRAFVNGKPLFGTLVALVGEDGPLAGMIDMPVMAERWIGVAGGGTTLNGRPARTRGAAGLAGVVLNATSPDMFQGDEARRFERLGEACAGRHFGGDCYLYGLLAGGWIDLVAEATMQPYDYLALVPVVEGAGGRIGDWSGRPLGLESDGTVLAASGEALFREALERLAG